MSPGNWTRLDDAFHDIVSAPEKWRERLAAEPEEIRLEVARMLKAHAFCSDRGAATRRRAVCESLTARYRRRMSAGWRIGISSRKT